MSCGSGANPCSGAIPDATAASRAIAEGFKLKGNDALKKGNYDQAVAMYTDAIGATPLDHIMYSNRYASGDASPLSRH